jgi:hypothetical protein
MYVKIFFLENENSPILRYDRGQKNREASWAILTKAGYSHRARIRAPGDDSGKLMREWARFRRGTQCWLEPVAAIPEKHCNLIVSTKPLRVA